jgi:hypothetical protein
MTMFHTFTDRIPKNKVTFFSDFIGSAKPFGIVKTNNATIGTPTDVYSNDNSDGLGNVTCALGSGTSGSVFANRIGIYQQADLLGANLTRLWDIRNGEYAIEARLKTSVSAAGEYIITCGYTLNHNQALESGAYFFHLNGQSTWRAAVSAGTDVPGQNVLAQFDTGVSVSQYQVLRVVSTKAATNFEFFVNGNRVWKWVGGDVASRASAASFAMPCVEIRDRTAGGGGRANSFTVDYMLTEERLVR